MCGTCEQTWHGLCVRGVRVLGVRGGACAALDPPTRNLSPSVTARCYCLVHCCSSLHVFEKAQQLASHQTTLTSTRSLTVPSLLQTTYVHMKATAGRFRVDGISVVFRVSPANRTLNISSLFVQNRSTTHTRLLGLQNSGQPICLLSLAPL